MIERSSTGREDRIRHHMKRQVIDFAQKRGVKGDVLLRLGQITDRHALDFYGMLKSSWTSPQIIRGSVEVIVGVLRTGRETDILIDEVIDRGNRRNQEKIMPAVRKMFLSEKGNYSEEEWSRIKTAIDSVFPESKKKYKIGDGSLLRSILVTIVLF